MEHLFSTNIGVNNENVVYDVVFDHELYNFTPEGNHNSLPSFSFRRNHDEWEDQGTIPPELRQQAIDALEKYLLKQH